MRNEGVVVRERDYFLQQVRVTLSFWFTRVALGATRLVRTGRTSARRYLVRGCRRVGLKSSRATLCQQMRTDGLRYRYQHRSSLGGGMNQSRSALRLIASYRQHKIYEATAEAL